MREKTERTENAGAGAETAEPQGGNGPEAEAVEGRELEASEAGSPAGGSSESASPDVQDLRDELQALNDRHLRLAAEFDNYRKRNERDRQALVSRLQADLVGALLDVLDDMQRVEESGTDTSAEAVLEGVRLVERKFLGVLEGAGLEPVAAEGAPFDPEVMEALMTVPTDDPERDHHVADVFQRGYRFRGALLRPARVRVLQYEEPSDQAD